MTKFLALFCFTQSLCAITEHTSCQDSGVLVGPTFPGFSLGLSSSLHVLKSFVPTQPLEYDT